MKRNKGKKQKGKVKRKKNFISSYKKMSKFFKTAKALMHTSSKVRYSEKLNDNTCCYQFHKLKGFFLEFRMLKIFLA